LNTLEIAITIDLPSHADDTEDASEPPDPIARRPDSPELPNAQRQLGPTVQSAEIDPDFKPSTDSDWPPSLEEPIRDAVRAAARLRGFKDGKIGVMVTDDPTIHEINLRHLDHDYPTDVISFTYDRDDKTVEGELVVSLCTARQSAQSLGWDWQSELLLYVVHGTLHICGLEDSTPDQRREMRLAEEAVFNRLGIVGYRRFDPDQEPSPASPSAPSSPPPSSSLLPPPTTAVEKEDSPEVRRR
jgi:probable rRNA maturation factor